MFDGRMDAPCKGCEERFVGCHDICPKSARGEYGYKEWKADGDAKKEKEEKKPVFTPAYQRYIKAKRRRKGR